MQRQVSFGEAVKMAFQKYATFSGRASRSEYWWFVLFNFIVSFVLGILDGMMGSGTETGLGVLSIIYSLAVFLPGLALVCRRLHDTGRGAGWIFIGLVPLIGGIWLLVLMCLASEPSANRFGPVPNDPDGEESNEGDVLI